MTSPRDTVQSFGILVGIAKNPSKNGSGSTRNAGIEEMDQEHRGTGIARRQGSERPAELRENRNREGAVLRIVTQADLDRVEAESRGGRGWPSVELVGGRVYRFDASGLLYLGRPFRLVAPDKMQASLEAATAILEFIVRNRSRSIIKSFPFSTYQVKHVFEDEYGYTGCGAMIAAAQRLGIPMMVDHGRDLSSPLLPINSKWLQQYERDRAKRRELERMRFEWDELMQELDSERTSIQLGSK